MTLVIGRVKFNFLLVHLCWQNLVAFFRFNLVECVTVPMIDVQHMVKLGVSDRRPEDDFRPVGKVSPMVKRRDWVMIVHMLQLFLRSQCLLNQVRMETT